MKKIFIYLLIFLFVCSCKDNTSSKYQLYLKDKTFLRLTNTENGDVLFLPSIAHLPKLRFSNTFYEDVGQEQTEFDNWYIKMDTKGMLQLVYSSDGDKESCSSIIILDTLNNILYYNGMRYMDSTCAIKLPYIIEDCEEGNEIALCLKWKREGSWMNSIASEVPIEYIPVDDLIKTNLTILEKENFKHWQGTYSFEYGRTQMREIIGAVTSFTILPEGIVKSKTTGDVLEQCIDEKGNMTGEERFLRKIDRDEIYEVVDVRQDSLKIRHTENLDEEHLLFKDKAGNYFIEGSGYFVPAPDSYYPLTKEK